MVKKHLNKLTFDKEKYPIYRLIQSIFSQKLNQIHTSGEKSTPYLYGKKLL